MKKILTLTIASLMALGASAQSSLPAPGGSTPGGGMGGGMSMPAPGGSTWGGTWGGGAGWGSPWGPPPPPSNPMWTPTVIVSPNWENDGRITVMACGYDSTGIWRNIPLRVEYSYDGLQYNVEVLNAWNPWTDTWNYGVDTDAINTSYYLHGNTYNFYVPLSTGTYYFNL